MDTIHTAACAAMAAGTVCRHDDLWWDAHQGNGSFSASVAHQIVPGHEDDMEDLATATNVPVGYWFLSDEFFFAMPLQRATTLWPREVTAHAEEQAMSPSFYEQAMSAFVQNVLKQYYSQDGIVPLVAKTLREYDHIPKDIKQEIDRLHDKDPFGTEITILWQMGRAPTGCIADTLCCLTMWHYENSELIVSQLAEIWLEALK